MYLRVGECCRVFHVSVLKYHETKPILPNRPVFSCL